jgi:outer membrane receptor protein involved in Fe transport
MKIRIVLWAMTQNAYTRKSGVVRAVLSAVLMMTCHLAMAQSSSGTISGHLQDKTGGTVNSGQVDLVNEETGAKVSTPVRSTGDFTFLDVQPGTFMVVVHAKGYKELTKDGLALSSSARLSAGTMVLEVGSVTDTVTVSADITPIQSTSAERSGLLDDKQLDNLLVSDRDFVSLMRTIPGVVGGGGATLPTINGVRSVYGSASVDGVTGSVREGKIDTAPNLDDIAEVKVLSANYQAEYGKATGGAVINVVTKSGKRDFHGSLYYYLKNEDFNANNWFNKYKGQPRPKSRFNTAGGNLGGPIFWPGHFNSNRDKLFFFYSMENLPNTSPSGTKFYMVPTALERMGDFSRTFNQGQTAQTAANTIYVRDPSLPSTLACGVNTGGPGCFIGNVIPAGRINPSIQAILNLYPLPNYTNLAISANSYNYITNYSESTPAKQEIFRLDYFVTSRLHMFFRGELQSNDNIGHNSTVNPSPTMIQGDYRTTAPNFAFNVTYTFSPTIVNELTLGTAGWSENNIYAQSELNKLTKSPSGYNLAQLTTGNNPLNLIPGVSFGLSNSPDIKYDSRFPLQDQVRLYSLTDAVTKVWGHHTVKIGLDLQTDSYLQSHASSSQPEGAFSFGRNTSNPNDSNFSYANALLGNFSTYQEPTGRFDYDPTSNVIDWYTQDQWKVTDRLTLDYGLRYTYQGGLKLKTGANFVPSMFDPTKAPVLYRPGPKVKGVATAIDPTTGKSYPGAYAGLFVPNTGNLSNGSILANTPGLPSGLVYGNGILVAPRVGFAFDPFGRNKTVLRGGFGIFYNEGAITGQEGDMTFNPPVTFNPQQFYGNVNSFQSAGGLIGPGSFGRAIDLHARQTSTLNASLGFQQEIGAGVVVDVAYVGTFGRHLSGQQNINEVPYGAHFQPANQSPAGGPLPDNFYRPYPSLGTITYQRDFLTSNYNAMQVQLTRRFNRGLEFGLAYTWSKSMDYADSYDGSVPLYDDLRKSSYGPGGDDHRHNLVVSYLYSLPRASRIWSNFATKTLLDNWQVSGIYSYLSGAPTGIGFSTTDGQDITGGGDSARVVVTGNPMQGATHSFQQYFNTAVFQRPSQVTVNQQTGAVTLSNGNAPKVLLFKQGVSNFDTALFKNFPIHERLAMQLRCETYNTLNSPEFNSFDTSAKFGPSVNGVAPQVSTTFGQATSSAGPRTMQLALRLNF